MIFTKKTDGKIEVPYFFYEGKFKEINTNYFINAIEEGLKLEDNKSFQTNIKGFMTNWTYFNNDSELNKLLWPILDVVDLEIQKRPYRVTESWGFKNGLGNYTVQHDHSKNNTFASGVIYLNEHPQLLNFPAINKTVKPEIGAVALFSSFLFHGCDRNLVDKQKYGISFNLAIDS